MEMEAGKMEENMVPMPIPRLFTAYPPRSTGMHSTGPQSMITNLPQILKYDPAAGLKEAETIQRCYNQLLSASADGPSRTPRPQYQLPNNYFGYAPPVLKGVMEELALDLARYGGYTFPPANLGEASVADALDPAEQVPTTTWFLMSNDDRSAVPTREVAALKID